MRSLACGGRAFLSHDTAAAIWGMLPTLPTEVEVTVVARRCESREGIRAHQIKQIDRRDVRREQGLWVSSPARALLEIAASRSLGDLARALDEGLARRVLDRRGGSARAQPAVTRLAPAGRPVGRRRRNHDHPLGGRTPFQAADP
jgi:hypothetical protein